MAKRVYTQKIIDPAQARENELNGATHLAGQSLKDLAKAEEHLVWLTKLQAEGDDFASDHEISRANVQIAHAKDYAALCEARLARALAA